MFSTLFNLIIFFEKLKKIKVIKKIKKTFLEKFFFARIPISKTNIKINNKCIANLQTGEKLNQNKKPIIKKR